MEPSSSPNELPDGERPSPEAPLNPPAEAPKGFGAICLKLAKVSLVLGVVLVPMALFFLQALPPRPGEGATRSEKTKWQRRQLEIEQAERDAQSVAERNP